MALLQRFKLDSATKFSIPGIVCAGVTAGLKPSGSPDLAVVAFAPGVDVSRSTCAGIFTTNRFAAAPVQVSRRVLGPSGFSRNVRGIVVNSGQANACTGELGLRNANEMVARTSDALSLRDGDQCGRNVLVMSTGIIGRHLDLPTVDRGISAAVAKLRADAWDEVACAIMTTDTKPKFGSVASDLGFSIGGVTKGAGMIHPNMATMLCLMATDVPISPECLHRALVNAADRSFHCIDVDGDTSTNDSMVVIASGAAEMDEITDPESEAYLEFEHAITRLSIELAKKIVLDAEGVTKLITIRVVGAADSISARQIAQTIAQSSLVKCAVFGGDPNWGRVLCAAGYSGVEFDTDQVDLWLGKVPSADSYAGSVQLVKRGQPEPVLNEAADYMKQSSIEFTLDLHMGSESATVWASDLSYKYIEINAEYTT